MRFYKQKPLDRNIFETLIHHVTSLMSLAKLSHIPYRFGMLGKRLPVFKRNVINMYKMSRVVLNTGTDSVPWNRPEQTKLSIIFLNVLVCVFFLTR